MSILHNRRPHPGQMRRLLGILGGVLVTLGLMTPAGRAQEALDAQTILSRAAEAQGRKLDGPRQRLSFHARMLVKIVTDRDDQVELRVETKFLGAQGEEKDRIWRSVIEDEVPTVTAFDGETPWTRTGSKPLTELVGADFAEDRDRLREDIELTRNLARLFLLDELAREMKDLERLPDESAGGKTAYVLGGRAVHRVNDRAEDVRLRLFIEHGTHHVLGCEIDYADPDRPTLSVCIWNWRKSLSGSLIPEEIKIHHDNAEEPSQIIRPGLLDFGVKLDPKAFAPPK